MKIGLVPMSAKPYHRGHHYLVTTAGSQNDRVLLFVSISDRCRKGEFPIYGEDMQQIWCNQIEEIIPDNVEPVYGGSPVRKVYETLIEAEKQLSLEGQLENTYTVYSDKEDTRLNYTVGRSKKPDALSPIEKYFPNLYDQGYVSFAAETSPEMFTRGTGSPDVSGAAMRNRLKTPSERDRFIADLPSDLSDESKSSIYTRLTKNTNESAGLDRAILEAMAGNLKKRPEKGTSEYSSYLEDIMSELQHIKSSYKSRKKSGWKNRKEASKIQDAYTELRRLRKKNEKLLMKNELIQEAYNAIDRGYNVTIDSSENEDLDVRSFLRNFKIK